MKKQTTKKRKTKKKTLHVKRNPGFKLVGPQSLVRKTLYMLAGYLYKDARAGLWKGGEVLTTTVDDAMAYSSTAKARAEGARLKLKYPNSYWIVLDISRDAYGL